MQTNSINFNNNAQVLNGSASRNGAAFAPGAVLVARIMEKNDMLTSLKTADGLSLNARAGSVSGAIGDEVRFEVVATADGPALRQIMEMKESFANTAVANADLQSLQDLMSKNDYYDKYLDERPQSEADRQLEYAIKANEAASRIKRALHRLTNLDSAIFGQLAAMGLNVDKIPTNFVDSVTGRMDSAISADTAAIVLRLEEMVDVICKIDTNKFARIIQKEGPLTLDDLYSAAHNNAIDTKKPIDDAAWAELVRHVNKFLADNEVEQSAENQDKARFLIERELPLDRENFGKLIFLSDIIANLDMETLVALTVDGVANGDSVGQTVAYEPSLDARLDGRTLSYQLEQAKARLEMSYQAAKNLYNADYPIDFSLQERAIAELTAAERGYLYNALEQAQAAPTAENQVQIVDTYNGLRTMNYASYKSYGHVIQKPAELTIDTLSKFITAEKYESMATIASLKYGDTFEKIAAQFAPLLKDRGFGDSEADIRAAQILTKNNMDLNGDNLIAVKALDAKIADVSRLLTPIMAAKIIADGENPAAMHVDELLKRIESFQQEYGFTSNDDLHRSILELDRVGGIDPEVRDAMMDIYRALNRISRNDGAGVGAAVNAEVELTLENLMVFAKSYDSGAGRKNTMNYTVDDHVYFAKHLVSSFISMAKPKPLAEFVQNNPLTDPLEKSVDKMAEITKNEPIEDARQIAEIQRVEQEISQANFTSVNQIKFLQDRGLALSMGNMRAMRNYTKAGGKLDEDFERIPAKDLPEFAKAAQSTALEGFLAGKTAEELNEEMIDAAENIADNGSTPAEISAMDILLKSLNFRGSLLAHGGDHSFAARVNERLTDVNMYVLNENLTGTGAAQIYISLKTAAGEVLAQVEIENGNVNVKLATNPRGSDYFANNTAYLAESLSDIGANLAEISITDLQSAKNKLSSLANLPI